MSKQQLDEGSRAAHYSTWKLRGKNVFVCSSEVSGCCHGLKVLSWNGFGSSNHLIPSASFRFCLRLSPKQTFLPPCRKSSLPPNQLQPPTSTFRSPTLASTNYFSLFSLAFVSETCNMHLPSVPNPLSSSLVTPNIQ